MRIQHNIAAMNAYRNYNNNTSKLSGNLEKLSSGYKINRAGDDAAGLAISEKMRAQITGLSAAQKNVKDGISLVKTAEGAMQEIQDMLNRMDYLATQSANGTYDNEVDRLNLQKEVDALKTEINRIADSANFNGIKLLDGSQGEAVAKTQAMTVSSTITPTAGSLTVTGMTVASSTASAGTKQSGGAIDFPTANFGSATGHYGLHEGTDLVNQAAPQFTIDLKDIKMESTATANKTVTLSIDFAGIKMSITVAGAAGGVSMSAASMAAAFVAATHNAGSAGMVSIGGLVFNVTVDSSSKLKFTLNTAANATFTTAQAASVNAKIQGSEVKVAVTSNDGTSKVDQNYVHGLEEVKKAVAAEDGKLSGISLTLDDKIVKHGQQLTIGDTTYIFKTKEDAAFDEGDATLIDVSKFSGEDQYIEAARQLASGGNNAVTGTQTTANGGATATFEISLVSSGGKVIHLDQKKGGGTTEPKFLKDDLQGMFKLSTAVVDADKGSITVTAGTANVTAAAGDRFAIGDKTYTIGDDMSAASFNDIVKQAALQDAYEKVSEKYGGKFNFTLNTVNGTITAALNSKGTAGVDDAQTKVDAVKQAIVDALEGFQVAKAGTLTATVNSAAVSGGASATLAATAGDKFIVGGKTYTIVGDDEEPTAAADIAKSKEVKITAASFGAKLKEITAEAVASKVGEKYSDFNFTVSGANVTVELKDGKKYGDDDRAFVMNKIKKDLEDGFKNYSLERITASDAGKAGLKLQIGDTSDSFNQMAVKIGNMHTSAMGTGKTTVDGKEVDVTKTIADIDISNPEGAQEAIAVIKNAINYVSSVRGDLGAIQNRLDHTANNLSVMAENIQDAESTIRDTDVAEEMMSYVKNNILVQSAQAMLAQANQLPQGVLQLLG